MLYDQSMVKTVNQIDNRIERLRALMKRLRAERRVAILRERHQQIKFGRDNPVQKGVEPCPT